MAKKKPTVRPPRSAYDPALRYQLQAARRGLMDLRTQTGMIDQPRLTEDLYTGQADYERQGRELGEDVATRRSGVETDYGRSLSDLLTQRTQTTEDYTRNLAQLQRNYDRLGSAQTQKARSVGLAQGGAGAQAQRKRAENQAWEKAPIDTGQQRFLSASQQSEQRLGEDRGTALAAILRAEQRGGEGLERAGEELGRNYARGSGDLSRTLQLAEREYGVYKPQVQATMIDQALQGGWKPQANLWKPPKKKGRRR